MATLYDINVTWRVRTWTSRETLMDAKESQSGTIRTDQKGARARRCFDKKSGKEVWSSPPDGAAGTSRCNTTRAKEAPVPTADVRTGNRFHQSDSGRRSEGTTQTTTHSQAHLRTSASGTAAGEGSGANRARVCARAKGSAWFGATRSLCATSLRMGPRSASRLV